MTDQRPDLATVVATAADQASLGGNAPSLLLEIQTGLGSLADLVTTGTDRGRRPFRPGPDWGERLGRVAFDLFHLADHTGVDLDAAIRRTADTLRSAATVAQRDDTEGDDWPFPAS